MSKGEKVEPTDTRKIAYLNAVRGLNDALAEAAEVFNLPQTPRHIGMSGEVLDANLAARNREKGSGKSRKRSIKFLSKFRS